MAGPRSRWWTHKDAARLLSRAERSNGGPITRDELRYLRDHCVLLLHGPLELDDYDRAGVEQLHRDVLSALVESAGERIEVP
jgi:hypothetical protein